MRKNNLLINFINSIHKHIVSGLFGLACIGIYIWSAIFNDYKVDSVGFLLVSMWLTKFLFDGENEG